MRPSSGALIHWFDVHERPLPWRATTPWGVLVSEFMLQQTPVDRVLPVWHAWLDRWPTPGRSRLGPPLRCTARVGTPRLPQAGPAPARERGRHRRAARRRGPGRARPPCAQLPGVGDYTAAAVLAFAFGRRSIVLDTNVRRVLFRAVEGVAQAPSHITTGRAPARGRPVARRPWPKRPLVRGGDGVRRRSSAPRAAPRATTCPVRDRCAWTAAGQPSSPDVARRQPEYVGQRPAGTRAHPGRPPRQPVPGAGERRSRPPGPTRPSVTGRSTGLLADGLVVRLPGRRLGLPH